MRIISDSEYRKLVRNENRFKNYIVSGVLFGFGLILAFAPQYKILNNEPDLVNIFSHVGSAFVIAACSSFLFDMALRKSFFREINAELTNNFSAYFENADRINHSGIECVYDDFPDKQIEHGFSTAKREIIVIQTWFSNIAGIERAITTAFAASSSCTAEVYLLKPDCDLAKMRSRESNLATEDSLAHSVEQAEEMLYDLAQKNNYGERLRCFRYESIPTISVFKHDDTIYWGPYFKERRTWNTPWFELTPEKTKLYEIVEIYIAHIRAKAVRHIPMKARTHEILPPALDKPSDLPLGIN